jgi:hypothetical protein
MILLVGEGPRVGEEGVETAPVLGVGGQRWLRHSPIIGAHT